MDRYKCPIHGKIVARDEQGKVADSSDVKQAEETPYQPWKDEQLIADINASTGKNIKIIENKKKPSKGNRSKKATNLTDLNKLEDTARSRLEKRLFNSKNLKKVGSILDSIERRLHYEKYHHNYNYAISL
jgi:UV-stimulated scaffold protein A